MSVAIIAEYNPFHNGHIYQLQEAKKRFPNENIYIILSDNFTQRGDFNVLDFEKRKQLALEYGATGVIRMDFESSTQAAHIFAQGAIDLVNKNKIDKIFFGSETADIQNFYKAAQTLKHQKAEYNKLVKQWLKQGYSFVKASSEALKALNGQEFVLPNDILGLEYVKAIVENDYPIEAFCLQRTIPFHSETTFNEFASASYLREKIYKKEDVSKYSPVIFESVPDRLSNHWNEIKDKITNWEAQKIASIKLVSEGIENLFKKQINCETMEEFIDRCTSRRYTKNRIQRILLYIYLEIFK
ncbi:nucleotidyltransferase [[Mycoplasma] gypis]|uniref:tRNA(Met) cytidine acetate ligase n=1 Tax=[Mycoplasma] gypis TaxID=92404 RepID=A0ABZ2RPN6_9BACT|nr:nucleotidyltransferase [[Mycoplasma] gypis]MBN0919501.1 nucleotidyltransferase [[Mycoplasma] gypis]